MVWIFDNLEIFEVLRKFKIGTIFHFNPYILEKIIEVFEIDQYRSNAPAEVFDPSSVEASDFFDAECPHRPVNRSTPVGFAKVPPVPRKTTAPRPREEEQAGRFKVTFRVTFFSLIWGQCPGDVVLVKLASVSG